MGPFEFGNTTVRSGTRLREGLIAINNSGKEGFLRERAGDIALIEMLAKEGVIDERGDETYSVGRKWRSALCKMGLLFDEYDSNQDEIGKVSFITPNGKRLIGAESLAAQQECFLRAIAAMQLNFNDKSYKVGPGFSPLKHIVKVLLSLEKETGSSQISFIEFASFAQFDPSKSNYEEIIKAISVHRAGRGKAKNKKKYDTLTLQDSVDRNGRVRLSTYIDYADENLRYLKSTGCFSSVGKGIVITPSKYDLLTQLVESIPEQSSVVEYWKHATEGSKLPTDDLNVATRSLETLEVEANKRGIPFKKNNNAINVGNLNKARYDLEELIALNLELDYAYEQRNQVDDILNYLCALLPKDTRPSGLFFNTEVEIPRGEGPAYLEWATWRAFLAINKLKNPPYESRKFKVDRDFLPINHAPGNGPDLVFEFTDFTLVVEVTLLTSDRQATAEQVGVRRHVYEIAKNTKDKPTYCLFLAPSIKNETARDFRKASYEEDDGSELSLTIIPITISTFMHTFHSLLKEPEPNPQMFQTLISECARFASESVSTAEWMSMVEKIFLSQSKVK
jgi:hypothetical protein